MKNKPTQKERVVKRILQQGFITRNECLRNYITRLSALILTLEQEGWKFDTKYTEGKDYCYKLISCPLQRVVYKVGEREIVTYKPL